MALIEGSVERGASVENEFGKTGPAFISMQYLRFAPRRRRLVGRARISAGFILVSLC